MLLDRLSDKRRGHPLPACRGTLPLHLGAGPRLLHASLPKAARWLHDRAVPAPHRNAR